MTVEAGCILQKVQEAAAAADRLFPLSLGAEGSCLIGGNLSTNAGGIAGAALRQRAQPGAGPRGRAAQRRRSGTACARSRKDNTGYDLKQLFIGAEGTLGVITKAVLKLFPLPRQRVTVFAAASNMAATLPLLARLREASGDPSPASR